MIYNIVATDDKYGIGKDGKIPWHNVEDMKWFKAKTTGQIVIMGRKTYQSIGKPLPNRINYIVSKTMPPTKGLHIFANPLECIKHIIKHRDNKEVYNIGGESLYKWYLDHNFVSKEYITNIPGDYACDRFYPKSQNKITETIPVGKLTCTVKSILNYHELQMINLVIEILGSPNNRDDRTAVGNRSVFGRSLRYPLDNHTIPLMLHRRVFVRGVFEELMLFIRGHTNNKLLVEKNIHIWTKNTTREFLDNKGLYNLPVGDIGHSYGFSFRHFGGDYQTCNDNYEGVGFDQIKYVINEIKTNPNSRRLIISLWEPNFMHKASLPPCLYNYQFYVSNGQLSCMMTQRSSDLVLAGGWNVATGSLLTYIIGHYTNTVPKELIWNIGDAHIYNNNIDAAEELYNDKDCDLSGLSDSLYPSIWLNNMPDDIEDVQWENIDIVNYNPIKLNKKIKFEMNA